MDYGITIRTSAPFADAAGQVRGALQAQGFGVLTEIDVQATLRDKLGRTWSPTCPQTMVAVTGQPSLQPVADEAAARLRAALDSLRETD
jgi:uncharacterized protein (DUF302 family)